MGSICTRFHFDNKTHYKFIINIMFNVYYYISVIYFSTESYNTKIPSDSHQL